MERTSGTRVNDKVRLFERLDGGAMGEVWIAYHDTLRTEVAVKFLADEVHEARSAALERFSREAAASARIRSPHVVQTFDHGATVDGTPYIVMELLEGETLAGRLKAQRVLPIDDTVELVRQAASALDSAHALGVIHRDIKPDNLFLLHTPGGAPFLKVLDFGTAAEVFSGPQLRLTAPGTVIGTPSYLCRDLILDPDAIGPTVDLWALSVVAYRCLTGKLPFEGRGPGEVAASVVELRYAPPSQHRPELGVPCDSFFARAFHEDRALRPASGADLARQLDRAVSHVPRPRHGAHVAVEEAVPETQRLRLKLRESLARHEEPASPPPVAVVDVPVAVPASPLSVAPPSVAPPPRRALQAVGLAVAAGLGVGITLLLVGREPSAVASAAPGASVEAAPAPAPSASAPVAVAARNLAPDEPHAPLSVMKWLEPDRIEVPAGEVWLGCDDKTDADCRDDERPGRPVQVDAFLIDRHELRVEVYARCVKEGACTAPASEPGCNFGVAGHDKHPVNCVDHEQATRFCRWVGARLPTEAEWEKSARGADRRRYAWAGVIPTCGFAVIGGGQPGCHSRGTEPVGAKPGGVSPYGVLNLTGNVREWAADWYAPGYEGAGASNPTGPTDGQERVVRGASYKSSARVEMRTSARGHLPPTTRSPEVGFRCVKPK